MLLKKDPFACPCAVLVFFFVYYKNLYIIKKKVILPVLVTISSNQAPH